jgi:hypothetical protein
MAITLNGSTGIVEANIADNAITTNKIASGAVSSTDLAVGAARANFGAGAVLQIQETIQTVQPAFTNYVYNDLGLSVNITPSSSSNKILILWNVNFGGVNNSYCAFQVRRNTTFINQPGQTGVGEECTFAAKITDDYTVYNCSGQFLDSPSTISQVTYDIIGSPKRSGTGNTLYINRSGILGDDNQFRTVSSITVMEIAA